MAEISGKMFIIIGIAIAGGSFGINLVREDNSFFLFMIVGGLFFIYGIAKAIMQRKDTQDIHDKHLRGKPMIKNRISQSQHYSPHQQIYPIPPQHTQQSFCPSCGNKLATHSNFCSDCGRRLR